MISKLLEQAFDRVRQLPEADQEAIAALIFQELEADQRWEELFADPRSIQLLDRLADQALKGIRAGQSRPLNLDDR